MIPLYTKTATLQTPTNSIYYLLAGNGIFLVRKTRLFESVTESGHVRGLERQTTSLRLSFPKLPCELLARIYGFFLYVYRQLDGEAIVFIYYSPERRIFHADAPPQQLTRHRTRTGWHTEGRVQYRSLPRPMDFIKLGDAHSHGDSAAFFSSVDDRDDSEDGLRVVMGKLDQPLPEIRASFIASGVRFSLRLEHVLEEFDEPLAPPAAWIRRISYTREASAPGRKPDHESRRR
jgi:hypothetical protein